MKAVVVASLFAVSALGAPLGTPRRPVIAIVPAVAADQSLRKLGALIGARASALIDSAATSVELDSQRARDGKKAGAELVITSKLEALPKKRALRLSGTVSEAGRSKPFMIDLPSAWPEALQAGSDALAKLTGAKQNAATQPASKSAEALMAAAECYEGVNRQTLAVEAPILLDTLELGAAMESCRSAIELDPSLSFARATLALAEVMMGDDAAATKSLALLADDSSEAATLAQFWLITRYQSNQAGIASLQQSLAVHRTRLRTRVVLAETFSTLGEHAKAASAWSEIAAMVPAAPWALGPLSAALSRLGKRDEALASARKGVELGPQSREAQTHLANRLIEASRLDEAIALLKPLTDSKHAGAQELLLLGWVYWLKSDAQRAATFFQASLDRATSAAQWRTRGKAFYNLALVEAYQGRSDSAKVALKASLQTGYRVARLDSTLQTISHEVDRSRGQAFDGGHRPSLMPRESSLFALDEFGELEPLAIKAPPPEGLVLSRF